MRRPGDELDPFSYCFIQGADAIPPTPFMNLMDEANQAWKAIFWVSK